MSSSFNVYATYSSGSVNFANSPRSQTMSAGVQFAVSSTSNVLFEVVQRKVHASDRAQLAWTLGYDHHLSKRTALYGRLLNLNNRGASSLTPAGAPVTANSGDDARVIALGIRHAF